MNKTINDLIQLQDLIQIQAQHKTIKPKNHLAQLNNSIEKMTASLPDDIRSIFTKLQRNSQLAIVPIHNNSCTGCGMDLPVGQVNEIKMPTELQQCPTCSRILYMPPKNMPLMTGTTASKYGPRQTGIAKYTSPELMIPELGAQNADQAIEELCALMLSAGFVHDGEQMAEIAMERESVVSTAVDHGAAFPHARGIEGGGLTLAFGKSTQGFIFDSAAAEPSHFVFFIAIPTAASAFYLKLLAGLTESLQSEASRKKLLKAETPERLMTVLLQTTRKTIK